MDVAAIGLQRELAALADAPWTAHFNTGYHDGGWSGLALLDPDADATQLLCLRSDGHPLQPTPWLARCPQMARWLRDFPAPLRSARLLRLAPGGVIREHRDGDIGLPLGLVRLHLPIRTTPQVAFYVDGVHVPMREGECWYLDLSLPHRVRNDSTDTERVHLVVDCAVNETLLALLPERESGEAEAVARAREAGETAQQQLQRFIALALEDDALLDRLQAMAAVPAEGFDAAVCEAGAALGLRFDADEVRSARQAGQRRWLEQRGL